VQDILLLDHGFAPGEALDQFTRAHPEAGAIASFVGKVRPDQGVEKLEISHYAPLTLPGMEALADEAAKRWKLGGMLIYHRIGTMRPGAPIVLAAAAAKHRRAALEAVDFAMDHLKSEAWLWKREMVAGAWQWVEPSAADRRSRQRWKK
jgi:molybdopterin synthase catalytic subunit